LLLSVIQLPTLTYSSLKYPHPTEIHTLSLHDALPIYLPAPDRGHDAGLTAYRPFGRRSAEFNARKDPFGVKRAESAAGSGLALRSEEHTLNSSHGSISYAVFCLKKKKRRNM